MRAVEIGVGFCQGAVLGLKLFQLLLEVLDVFLLALAEGALRSAVLGTAALENEVMLVTAGNAEECGAELTMRMLETVSLSCAVVERLLLRSSCWGAVRSINSMEFRMAGWWSMYWGVSVGCA